MYCLDAFLEGKNLELNSCDRKNINYIGSSMQVQNRIIESLLCILKLGHQSDQDGRRKSSQMKDKSVYYL